MKFIKVNTLSAIYALLFFILLQLMVNVVRISNLTNWQINTTYILVFIGMLCAVIIFSLLVIKYIKLYFKEGKGIQWSTILWFPYSVLLLYIFSFIIPEMSNGETPNAGLGFIIIGFVLVYPIYIFLLNFYTKDNS